jgi:hypothetical protein
MSDPFLPNLRPDHMSGPEPGAQSRPEKFGTNRQPRRCSTLVPGVSSSGRINVGRKLLIGAATRGVRGVKEESKVFFFEKKNQKTFMT